MLKNNKNNCDKGVKSDKRKQNKFHYKQLTEPKKIYIDATTIKIREKLNIPRGERYELCRSVHAEANAIISASRDQMIGSSLYLVGKEVSTGNYVSNGNCCGMCKRQVINAGIEYVYIRDTKDEFRKITVADWITDDESLDGVKGY